MRSYIDPKQFYRYKYIINCSFKDDQRTIKFVDFVRLKINEYLQQKNISLSSKNELNQLIIFKGALFILLLIIDSKFNKKEFEEKTYNLVLKIILSVRLANSNIIKGNSNNIRSILNNINLNKPIKVIMPVCPDYEISINQKGQARYTFENLGGGIGPVAKKALLEYKNIIQLFKNVNCNVEVLILIGDFEANEKNCNRLKIKKDIFINKLESSIKMLNSSITGKANAGLFMRECIGESGWNFVYNKLLQDEFKDCNSFDSLSKILPKINHEKIFKMRMNMYRSWFPNSNDLFEVFKNQIIEYLSMSICIQASYRNSLIFACDHYSMAPYYGSFGGPKAISVFNSYS
ncbi:hypothetical protein CL656_04940 [bacterium]|nr:hypothetical protein [bacterium]